MCEMCVKDSKVLVLVYLKIKTKSYDKINNNKIMHQHSFSKFVVI